MANDTVRKQQQEKSTAVAQPAVRPASNTKSKRHDRCEDQSNIINQTIVRHLKEAKQKPRKIRRVKRSNHCCGEQVTPTEIPRNVSGLFRKMAVCIRCVVRLLTFMADRSSNLGPRSATEDQWHAMRAAVQGARHVEFNREAYRMRKNVSEFPRWARLISEKTDDTRSEAELKKLHALMRGMKSFDRFTEKIQLSLCRAFTYQSVGSGRIILRQGQIGENFYIIYSGSVFINFVDTDTHGNQFMKTETVLKRGDSFGELALLQDIQRTATVTCREACELLIVDKDTFSRVCPRIFENEMQDKIEFITSLPLFSPCLWGKEALKTICFEAQVLEYKTNKVVVADSTIDDWIYICMEGKCQVIRRLILSDEIEAINRRKSIRNSTRYDETGDLLGNKRQSFGAEGDRMSSSINLDKGQKEQLLESMQLEYQKRKRHRLNSSGPEKVLSFPRLDRRPTLTDQVGLHRRSAFVDNTGQRRRSAFVDNAGQRRRSAFVDQTGERRRSALVDHARQRRRSAFVDNAEERRHVTSADVLYLHIDLLQRGDTFNICNILCHGGGSSTESYSLISCGARLFRVKRKSFLRNTSPNILQHAIRVARMARYPTDGMLLYRYKEYLQWEIYKQTMLQDIMHSRKHGNERSTVNTTRYSRYDETQIKKLILQRLGTAVDICEGSIPAATWKMAERLTFQSTN